MIKRTAKAAKLRKRVYAHLFRHSRASYYANKLTEQQLKAFFGWTGDSRMAGTYVHLSGRDIDNAVMQANDVEVKTERTAPMLKVKTCQKCRFDNGIDSTYCARCGATLEIYTAVKKNEERGAVSDFMTEALNDPEKVDKIFKIMGKKKKR
jgi:ribosomal protein L40E